MKTRILAALLGGAAAMTVPAIQATAQVVPDYIVNRVPTAPYAGPLQTKKRVADYIIEGYAIEIRTKVAGLFEGCRQGQEVVFQDGTRFECSEMVAAEEMSPDSFLLMDPVTRNRVLFIGSRAYVGRILWIKGVKLHRAIHAGDSVLGIPLRTIEERRSIGPVDVTNGMIDKIEPTRSPFGLSVPELTTAPSNPPPNYVTLNPRELDSARKTALMTGAPPD